MDFLTPYGHYKKMQKKWLLHDFLRGWGCYKDWGSNRADMVDYSINKTKPLQTCRSKERQRTVENFS